MNDPIEKPPGAGSGNGGGGPEEPMPDGMEMISPVELVAQTLLGFAPHLTEEQALMVSEFVLREQEKLAEVLHAATHPPSIEKYPFWGMLLKGPDGGEGTIVAPKPGVQTGDLRDSLELATMVGMVTTPLVRALLRAHGFNYSFQQYKTRPGDKPRLIVV